MSRKSDWSILFRLFLSSHYLKKNLHWIWIDFGETPEDKSYKLEKQFWYPSPLINQCICFSLQKRGRRWSRKITHSGKGLVSSILYAIMLYSKCISNTNLFYISVEKILNVTSAFKINCFRSIWKSFKSTDTSILETICQ